MGGRGGKSGLTREQKIQDEKTKSGELTQEMATGIPEVQNIAIKGVNEGFRELRNYEKELLHDGNTSTFAHLVLEFHGDLCSAVGFDFNDAVNHYRSRIDFSDGIYTLWGNNGVKYFFDENMNFRGTKM